MTKLIFDDTGLNYLYTIAIFQPRFVDKEIEVA
jgi:hypothetical protein